MPKKCLGQDFKYVDLKRELWGEVSIWQQLKSTRSEPGLKRSGLAVRRQDVCIVLVCIKSESLQVSSKR